MRLNTLVAVLLSSCCVLPVAAQTPDPVSAAVTPQNNTGDLPYSTTLGSEIEHVDLASGNLIVTVPFTSVPGRKMNFDYGLRYDARFWITRQQTGKTYWMPDQRNWLTPATVGWTGTQGFATVTKGDAYCTENDGHEPNIGHGASIFYKGGTRTDGLTFTDRHGVKHSFLMNTFAVGCDRTIPAASFESSNLDGPSPDMDGFYATTGMTGVGATVVGPDGTIYQARVGIAPATLSGGSSDYIRGVFFGDAVSEQDSIGNAQAVAPGMTDSVGRTPVTQAINGNQISYTVQDSNGTPQVYTATLISTPVSTQFNIGGTFYDYNTNGQIVSQLVDSLLLPNGQSYRFQYDSWGGITQLTLPSGAIVNYKWTTCSVSGYPLRCVAQRLVTHDGTTDEWDFSYVTGGAPSQSASVTVTSPPDSRNVRHQTIYGYDYAQHLTRIQYMATSDPASQLLQYDMTWDTTRTDPSGISPENSLMTSLTTTLQNGLVSKKTYDYDLYAYPYQNLPCSDMASGFMECILLAAGDMAFNGVPFVPQPPTYLPAPTMFPGSHGNVTAAHEYDWGQGAPGGLVRQTLRTYLHDQDPNYFVAGPDNPGVYGRRIRNLVNRVVSETVYDGSALCSGTGTWAYANDGTITPPQPCGALKVAQTNIVYDYGNGSANGYKGLPTLVSRWAGGSTYLTTQYTYDAYGNLQSEQDPGGNTTNYVYGNAGACQGTAIVDAYPTSITNALNQTQSLTYYGCTGKLSTHTDENRQTTNYQYDWLGRPTYVTYPDGGQTHTVYDDVALTNTIDTLRSSSQIREVITQLDQLGRAVQTRLTSDPSGTAYTDMTYDSLGHVNSISNPYRSTADLTYGTTQNFYDARGRKVSQSDSYGSTARWSYSGNQTTSTDESGNAWSRVSDALGRLSQVVEPGALPTSYSYDPLGNLLSVVQHGGVSEQPRTRSFSYDSLSRLTSATNPETGTIQYFYVLPTGGFCSGDTSLPCSKVDARSLTTSYTYDALNRLTYKRYSDGTFLAAYGYDGKDAEGNVVTTPHANTIGLLTHISNHVNAATAFSYDAMHRIVLQSGCTPSDCGYSLDQVSAAYDLAGNMTDLFYPDGRHLKQTFDAAGRLSAVGDNGGMQNYLQSIGYNPDGSPGTTTLGNGIVQSVVQNNRMQVSSMSVRDPLAASGGTTYLNHSYCYSSADCPNGGAANNGNIWQITDNLSGSRTQAFTYDGLNRISSYSQGGLLQQRYAIDSFGNLGAAAGADYGPVFNPANQISGYVPLRATNNPAPPAPLYDASGNQTGDTDPNGLPRTLVFDAESRLAQIGPTGGSPSAVFTYGADGTRIRKQNYLGALPPGGMFTEYTYFNGQPIAEKDQAGAWTDSIYANGKKIAMVQAAKPTIHVHGVHSQRAYGVCGSPWDVSGQSSGVINYVLRQGDRLSFDRKDISALSGVWLGLNGGRFSGNGSYSTDLTDLSPDGTWHHVSTDLSGFFKSTVTSLVVGPGNPNTPVGPYDTWLQNITIQSTDGSLHPLFTGGSSSGVVWGQCADDVQSLTTEMTQVDSQHGTTFYASDHLGSAQMEFSASGTPLSLSQFMPFGAEINPPVTANHYKFTGKERDTESGLDYFGARYYASSMGRFSSPDDGSDQNPGNPQSWNLYSYGRNNPLIGTDPDGRTYNVCPAGVASGSAGCTNIDDKTFEANQKQDQANGVNYSKGTISDSSGTTQGSYTHDPDIAGDPAANIAALGNIGNQGMAAIRDFTVGSVVGGVTAGAGLAAFGGGIGTLTTVEGLSEGAASQAPKLIIRAPQLAHALRVALGHNTPLGTVTEIRLAVQAAIAAGAYTVGPNGVAKGTAIIQGVAHEFTGFVNGSQFIFSNIYRQ